MAVKETVNFDKDGDAVTIEVESGYSSLGSFILAFSKAGEYSLVEFGKEPKRIDDNVADIFLIPIPPKELANHNVVIIGKYRPAPGHSQIRVRYLFSQDDEIIHPTKIEETTDGDFMRFSHRFSFKEK